MSNKAGVFQVASRFNHSCAPSVKWEYSVEEGGLVFTADQDIEAGDELKITYGKSPLRLFFTYGFRCTCGYCAGVPSDEDLERVYPQANWF